MIINADSKDYLSTLTENTIDLIVTDPPYGLEFMGKNWDKALPSKAILRECLRVLKHGAFAFWLCSPRQDLLSRMIILLDSVGFKVNFTSLYWTYASGFPKSQNISKAIDKKLGLERNLSKAFNFAGKGDRNDIQKTNIDNLQYRADYGFVYESKHEKAQEMEGSYGGFQPKPAVEVILVTMKPLSEKTYLEQALKNGKGVTWLDSGRIPIKEQDITGFRPNSYEKNYDYSEHDTIKFGIENKIGQEHEKGRFSANLLVSDRILDTGKEKKGSNPRKAFTEQKDNYFHATKKLGHEYIFHDDFGDFSRYFDLDQWFTKQIPFFIVTKPSKTEKNLGLENLPLKNGYSTNIPRKCVICDKWEIDGSGNWCLCKNPNWIRPQKQNFHPTIKPITLKAYLIAIGSRKGDIILDPFVGSGTTSIAAEMLARKHLGIEKEQEYYEIAKERVKPENIRALIAFLKEQLPKLPKKKETKILTEFI